MSNPFPPTTPDPTTKRPWLRVTDARRATSAFVLGPGEFALTETGKQYNGDGATALKDLPAQGAGGGSSIVDNGDGTLTSNTGIVDNGDGTLSAA